MTETKTLPVHKIRNGNVRVAIWRNESGFFSVTHDRSFRKNDEWHRSTSYGRDDLPKLALALNNAYEWIFPQPSPKPTQA